MSLDLLQNQIAVLRLQAQSFAAQVQAIEATAEAIRIAPAGACQHPLESRELIGNFGSSEWKCAVCGAIGDGT